MKKINILSILMLLVVTGVLVTSCKNSEDGDGLYNSMAAPVADQDFTVTVNGQDVSLKCTNSSANSVYWVVCDSSSNVIKTATGKTATATISRKGNYTVKCGVSNGGDYTYSDSKVFNIATTDLSYLNDAFWKALTGSSSSDQTGGYKKKWKLDIVTITTIDDAGGVTVSHKSAYFGNPLDFYGDAEAGGSSTNIWGPWGGTDIYGWGGTPEQGTISFDGVNLTAKMEMTEGVKGGQIQSNWTSEGNFTMDVEARDPNFLTLTDGTSLWDYMLTKASVYKMLGSLSSETGTMHISDNVRMPIDEGRMLDSNSPIGCQFKSTDLHNFMIMHCSDSSLVIRLKRSYEGANESKCWLLYNFVVDGYDYGVKAYTHHVDETKATNADVAGDYVLNFAPVGWIGWSNDCLYEPFTSLDAFKSNWNYNADAWTTAMKTTVHLGADGNAIIKAFDNYGANEHEVDYNTTYNVNKGYVTFGSEVGLYYSWAKIKGTNFYFQIAKNNPNDGLWLAQNDGSSQQSVAFNLVKSASPAKKYLFRAK